MWKYYNNDIALWGPQSAGKDWLFKSFAQELDFFNEENSNFTFQIREGNIIPMERHEREITFPTPIEDQWYIFLRKRPAKTLTYEISTSFYSITLHDDKRQKLIDLTFPKPDVPVGR
jgi:hypothetical protein